MRAIKIITFCLLILVLVASGWVIRGLVTGGQPPSGSVPTVPGGPGGPAAATEVVTATVQDVTKQPQSEYVGHVEAIQDAEIYAQISGTIQAVRFEEGRLVKKGDLLFAIDPDRYQAEVQAAEAKVAQSKANLKVAEASRTYAEQYQKRLLSADSRSVAKSDLEKAESEVRSARASEQQAKAEIQQAEADLSLARINLNYTEIRSPIDGRIGRAELTKGDYVNTGADPLARVVQIDPVRVRFNLSDREYLNLIKDNSEAVDGALTARLQLPNGDVFGSEGRLDFFGNQMSLETGTIPVYLRFNNSDGLLIANSYVTVLMTKANSESSLVLPQVSVMTDSDGEYVYVVTPAGIVEQRRVQLGDQMDENRIVLSGVAKGEQVIVQGLQKARPGQTVKTQKAGLTSVRQGA